MGGNRRLRFDALSRILSYSPSRAPREDQGERKLLVESLVEVVEIGKNKRVAASLRPPFGFGLLSPDLAPRGGRPQAGRALVVRVLYDLTAYCGNYRVAVREAEYSTSGYPTAR